MTTTKGLASKCPIQCHELPQNGSDQVSRKRTLESCCARCVPAYSAGRSARRHALAPANPTAEANRRYELSNALCKAKLIHFRCWPQVTLTRDVWGETASSDAERRATGSLATGVNQYKRLHSGAKHEYHDPMWKGSRT